MDQGPYCKTCKSENARGKYRSIYRDLDIGDMV